MNAAVLAPIPTLEIVYRYRGAVRTLFRCHDREVILAGAAGTGKTRAWLELTHLRAATWPGSRHLLLRKTLVSLKASAVVTFDERVRPELDGVTYRGGGHNPPGYYYPNGSFVGLGGLDNPVKTFSTDYDSMVVFEANELLEGEWESLMRALRHGAMPYQQLGGDCNPDAPTHWIRARSAAGKLTLLESHHEDNPTLWTLDGRPTTTGADYLARLDALTGVRYLRLRRGIWAAAEGMVYQDDWQPSVHLIDRFALPPEWPRYWSIDWGHTHPFVWQCWARDGDGRLYREHEVYHTKRTVPEHVATIRRVTQGKPAALPHDIVADPSDAGSRALFEHLMQMRVRPAENAVSAGIQAVKERLRVQGDGRARLYLLRDSLVETDPALREAHLPTCTEQEFESYVWREPRATLGGTHGEEPVKENDHGLDCARYMVAYFDLRDTQVSWVEVPW